MCDKAKGYLGVVREYSREITMLIGFAVAATVYSDNKEQARDFMQHMEHMTEAIQDVTLRLNTLEKKIEFSSKVAQ